MSVYRNRAREKLVPSVHLTLYPGVDDNFIRFIQSTPPRSLARMVCECMDAYLRLNQLSGSTSQQLEGNHG